MYALRADWSRNSMPDVDHFEVYRGILKIFSTNLAQRFGVNPFPEAGWH